MSDQNSQLTKKVFRGGLIIIIFSILTSPLGYLVRMIFSRALSITDYGLIYAVLSFFGVFTIVNDLGFGYATSYFIPKYYQEKKIDLCWYLYKYDQIIEVFTSIFLSLIFIVSSDFLSTYFFKHDGAKELIFLFSLYLISSGVISSIQHFLVGLQKDIYYSSIEFLRLGFTLLFSFFFFIFDVSNVLYYALAFVFSYLILSLLYLILVEIKFKELKTPLKWKPELFKKAIKYALPTFLTSSLYIFINHIDVLFLTYFSKIESVGIYNIIFPIASIPILLLQPMQKMILPLVSELADNNKQKLEILMKQLLRLIPFIGIYFALFTFMFSKGIISMMFGYKWVAQADTPLKIMALAYSISLLNIYLISVVSGLGEVKKRLWASILLFVLSIVSGIFGAKYFGIIGIILANSVLFAVSAFLMYIIISKSIKVHIPFVFYFKLILFCIVTLFSWNLLKYEPISVFEVVFSGIIYTLIMTVIALKVRIVDFNLLKNIFGEKFTSNRFLGKFM